MIFLWDTPNTEAQLGVPLPLHWRLLASSSANRNSPPSASPWWQPSSMLGIEPFVLAVTHCRHGNHPCLLLKTRAHSKEFTEWQKKLASLPKTHTSYLTFFIPMVLPRGPRLLPERCYQDWGNELIHFRHRPMANLNENGGKWSIWTSTNLTAEAAPRLYCTEVHHTDVF